MIFAIITFNNTKEAANNDGKQVIPSALALSLESKPALSATLTTTSGVSYSLQLVLNRKLKIRTQYYSIVIPTERIVEFHRKNDGVFRFKFFNNEIKDAIIQASLTLKDDKNFVEGASGIVGYTDTGIVNIPFTEVESIVFENPKKSQWKPGVGFFATLETINREMFQAYSLAFLFGPWNSHAYLPFDFSERVEYSFPVLRGMGSLMIPFDKITSVDINNPNIDIILKDNIHITASTRDKEEAQSFDGIGWETELGWYEIDVANIARIKFDHSKDISIDEQYSSPREWSLVLSRYKLDDYAYKAIIIDRGDVKTEVTHLMFQEYSQIHEKIFGYSNKDDGRRIRIVSNGIQMKIDFEKIDEIRIIDGNIHATMAEVRMKNKKILSGIVEEIFFVIMAYNKAGYYYKLPFSSVSAIKFN